MKATEYILSKQIAWAQNNTIPLIGSKGERGRPSYTENLDQNLFEPLLSQVKEDFNNADGGELKGSPKRMSAVHSSSACGVNIFQYWEKRKLVSVIAAACGLCSKNNTRSENIRFEQKFPICGEFKRNPNVDVVIENSPGSRFQVYAIECKFSEAYSSRGHSGFDPKYFDLEKIWNDIPNLKRFAQSISPEDEIFRHLHPAQLVKHILGLKNKFDKNRFRLLYLWYDVPGEEGVSHRKETESFAKIAKYDGIKFHTLSYQELIITLCNDYRIVHEKYVDYISSRYL